MTNGARGSLEAVHDHSSDRGQIALKYVPLLSFFVVIFCCLDILALLLLVLVLMSSYVLDTYHRHHSVCYSRIPHAFSKRSRYQRCVPGCNIVLSNALYLRKSLHSEKYRCGPHAARGRLMTRQVTQLQSPSRALEGVGSLHAVCPRKPRGLIYFFQLARASDMPPYILGLNRP